MIQHRARGPAITRQHHFAAVEHRAERGCEFADVHRIQTVANTVVGAVHGLVFNGQPVAKLSDTPSKNMCDDERYLAYLRQVFDIPQVS